MSFVGLFIMLKKWKVLFFRHAKKNRRNSCLSFVSDTNDTNIAQNFLEFWSFYLLRYRDFVIGWYLGWEYKRVSHNASYWILIKIQGINWVTVLIYQICKLKALKRLRNISVSWKSYVNGDVKAKYTQRSDPFVGVHYDYSHTCWAWISR